MKRFILLLVVLIVFVGCTTKNEVSFNEHEYIKRVSLAKQKQEANTKVNVQANNIISYLEPENTIVVDEVKNEVLVDEPKPEPIVQSEPSAPAISASNVNIEEVREMMGDSRVPQKTYYELHRVERNYCENGVCYAPPALQEKIINYQGVNNSNRRFQTIRRLLAR